MYSFESAVKPTTACNHRKVDQMSEKIIRKPQTVGAGLLEKLIRIGDPILFSKGANNATG